MGGNKYWHLFSLLRNERRSLDDLLHLQMTKLRALASHAYQHVPFYREKFDQVGFRPGDIKTIRDLQGLPLIGKADFHQRPAMDYVDQRIDHRKSLIPIRTSGSSGQALEFYIDHAYDQFRKAQFLRPYITNGQKLTDRIVTFKGRPREHKKYFEYISVLREKQISSHLDPAHQLEGIRQLRPAIIRGYPSVLALIGAKILECEPLTHYPRRIFTDSELLTPAMRRTIERAFQRPIVDIYGTLETDNIAYQCGCHGGYHIAIDSVIMEFLKNGRPVEAGETGEIVCTVLNNLAMPFIRYRMNDYGIYSDKPCPCGRSFPLMTGLQGRTHDYAVTSAGEPISSTILLGEMDRFAGSVEAFQILQESVDRFKVTLIPGEKYRQSTAAQIQSRFAALFPGAVVDITIRKRLIYEDSGKFMPFKSLVHGGEPAAISRPHEG